MGAGIAERLAAERADMAITARTLDHHDHLTGSLLETKARLRWIVNVSSATARHRDGPPFHLGAQGTTIAVHGASKAALNRMTNGLAAELHGTGIRVNSVQPRAAVLSEGADALVGGTLRPDQIESMEEMVEGAVALCDCPEDVTWRIVVSLDLIAEWGLDVRNLDGTAR